MTPSKEFSVPPRFGKVSVQLLTLLLNRGGVVDRKEGI